MSEFWELRTHTEDKMKQNNYSASHAYIVKSVQTPFYNN